MQRNSLLHEDSVTLKFYSLKTISIAIFFFFFKKMWMWMWMWLVSCTPQHASGQWINERMTDKNGTCF